MFDIIFTDKETGAVTFAISQVVLIRYITRNGIGFIDGAGRDRMTSFGLNTNLEIKRAD